MYVFDFTVLKGDTYQGNYVFQVMKNNVPLDLTGAIIKAQFKQSVNAVASLTMSTTANTIEIVDALLGKFKFAKQMISLKAGNYPYDVQITIGTDVSTYLKGILTVNQDITE